MKTVTTYVREELIARLSAFNRERGNKELIDVWKNVPYFAFSYDLSMETMSYSRRAAWEWVKQYGEQLPYTVNGMLREYGVDEVANPISQPELFQLEVVYWLACRLWEDRFNNGLQGEVLDALEHIDGVEVQRLRKQLFEQQRKRIEAHQNQR